MNIYGLGFLGGLISSIFGFIGKIFEPLFSVLQTVLGVLFDSILYFIPQLIYGLCNGISIIIDFIQGIFKQLAGIGEYRITGTNTVQNGDIVSWMMQSKDIQNVFYALVAISILLIIIFTIVQIIRNTYGGADKDATAFTIIGRGLKACVFFFFIPVVCLAGLELSAGVFRALNEVTGGSDNVSVSNQVMVAGLQGANRVSLDKTNGTSYIGGVGARWKPSDLSYCDSYTIDPAGNITPKGSKTPFTNSNAETLDMAIKNNWAIYKGDKYIIGGTISNNILNNEDVISTFYHLAKANWIIIFMGLILTITVFMNFMFGLIQRIFNLVVLFVLSPLSLAFAPMDDLAGFKDKFIKPFYKQVVSAYAVLLSLNLFFIILPAFTKIQLFFQGDGRGLGSATMSTFNLLTQTFFVLAALTMLPGLRDKVADFLGADKMTEKSVNSVIADNKKSIDTFKGGVKSAWNMPKNTIKYAKDQGKALGKSALTPVRGAMNTVRKAQSVSAEGGGGVGGFFKGAGKRIGSGVADAGRGIASATGIPDADKQKAWTKKREDRLDYQGKSSKEKMEMHAADFASKGGESAIADLARRKFESEDKVSHLTQTKQIPAEQRLQNAERAMESHDESTMRQIMNKKVSGTASSAELVAYDIYLRDKKEYNSAKTDHDDIVKEIKAAQAEADVLGSEHKALDKTSRSVRKVTATGAAAESIMAPYEDKDDQGKGLGTYNAKKVTADVAAAERELKIALAKSDAQAEETARKKVAELKRAKNLVDTAAAEAKAKADKDAAKSAEEIGKAVAKNLPKDKK